MNIYLAVKIRNEIDIVECFLSHIDGLFDKVYVMDQKSKDGTTQILKEAASQRSNWEYIFLDFNGLFHSLTSNFIMQKAFSEGADHLVFLDTDEFFYIKGRDDLEKRLNELEGFNGAGTFHWRDVTPVDFTNREFNPLTEVWLSPYRSDYQKITIPKALYESSNHKITITEGNHEVLDADDHIISTKDLGDILHIPTRSLDQLEKKYLIASIAHLAMENRNPLWGHHIFDRLRAIAENSLVTDALQSVYPTFVNHSETGFQDKGFMKCNLKFLDVHFSEFSLTKDSSPPGLAAVIADALLNFKSEDLVKVELYLTDGVMRLRERKTYLPKAVLSIKKMIQIRVKILFQKITRFRKLTSAKSTIMKSELFNPDWYLQTYPEIKSTNQKPLDHYLKRGAIEGKNPSPSFNTKQYLIHNPDVKNSAINPLLHYLTFGKDENREIYPVLLRQATKIIDGVNFLENTHPSPGKKAELEKIPVDIIICIHDALEELKLCLDSVIPTMRAVDHLILVNDQSDNSTKEFLTAIQQSKPEQIQLIHTPHRYFYTKALNLGLSASSVEHIIVLNSDTVVYGNWINKLIDTMLMDQSIGIVSPLSNAADQQSICNEHADIENTRTTALLPNLPVNEINQYCQKWSKENGHAVVPYLNGFCMLLKKDAVMEVGDFDDRTFQVGYGEDIDYCFRLIDAGYKCVIATDTYITHYLLGSFSPEMCLQMKRDTTNYLRHKYSHIRVSSAQQEILNNPLLNKLREDIYHNLMLSYS